MGFTPRTTKPDKSNSYYDWGSDFEGECTWYANGRSGEITGGYSYAPHYYHGSGSIHTWHQPSRWLAHAAAYGFSTSSTEWSPGDVIVYTSHVAVIEYDNGDGTYHVSDYNHNGDHDFHHYNLKYGSTVGPPFVGYIHMEASGGGGGGGGGSTEYVMNLLGSDPSEAGGTIYTGFTSGQYDTPSWSVNSSISWTDDDVSTEKYLHIKCEDYDSENYKFIDWSFSRNNPNNPATFKVWKLSNNPSDVYAQFKEYEKYYLKNDNVHGSGHLEGSFEENAGYKEDFLWRPEIDKDKTIYAKPVPDGSAIFRGWDNNGVDISKCQKYSGNTWNDLTPEVWFADRVTPDTWKFTNTGIDRKWITHCSATITGRKLGEATTNFTPIKVELCINKAQVATGTKIDYDNPAGIEISSDGAIQIKCLDTTGDYIDLKLENFTLKYYYYSTSASSSGPTGTEKYLNIRDFPDQNTAEDTIYALNTDWTILEVAN